MGGGGGGRGLGGWRAYIITLSHTSVCTSGIIFPKTSAIHFLQKQALDNSLFRTVHLGNTVIHPYRSVLILFVCVCVCLCLFVLLVVVVVVLLVLLLLFCFPRRLRKQDLSNFVRGQ